MSEKKEQIVAFLDWVIPKNKIQIDSMHTLGYSLSFFVGVFNSSSSSYFNSTDNYKLLETDFFSRIRQVFTFLKANKNSIHHLEIYPGGRFSFIYILLANFFSLKCICVERGDLVYFKKGGYNIFTRFSMWLCYRYADFVWYREPYMASLLDEIGAKKTFFIHNAVPINTEIPETNLNLKSIDFLWANRLTPERRSEWFVDILSKEHFKFTKNKMAGILTETLFPDIQDYALTHKPLNLDIVDYVSDLAPFYLNSKFFVLPADLVFANNALLEAMSFGVVPLISSQSGSDLIVDDGINGFVFEHTKEAFELAMKKALTLSDELYRNMSQCAILKVNSQFSETNYLQGLKELYKRIEN